MSEGDRPTRPSPAPPRPDRAARLQGEVRRIAKMRPDERRELAEDLRRIADEYDPNAEVFT